MQVEFPGEQSTVVEVAATVPVSDDPTLPALTFRFWVLGTVFSVFSAAVAQFMYFRLNQISLNNFAIILMSYPCGVFMAKVLPDWRIGFNWPSDFLLTRGTFVGGSLNPGPFNIKEHTLIMAAASTLNGAAYATDILAIQRLFYGPNQNPFKPDPNGNVGWCAALLLIITSQCIGYGFAGLCRTWLVRPAAMWWPVNVVLSNVLHVFHAKSNEGIVGERVRLFNKLTAWVVIYEFLPQYFATYLAHFSILCLAFGSLQGKLGNPAHFPPENPASPVQYGGGGFMALTLDWQQIGTSSPMYTPFWAQLNILVPIFLGTWIVTPWMYKKNVWGANMYPLASAQSFDIFGQPYNVTRILNNVTLVVEDDLYDAYSPLRLSTFWAVAYGSNFGAVTAVLVHIGLFHGKQVLDGFRASRVEDEDVHIKMMRKYPEVPHTWYLATLIIFFAVSVVMVEHYTDYQIRWWGIVFAMLTVAIFIIPLGIINAIANTTIGTNVITEFMFGLAVPGKAIANVCFKTYGTTAIIQALNLVSDLKLAVYMKIPPRAMFVSQLYATFIGAVVNYAVLDEIIKNVPDVWFANHQLPDGQPSFNPQWGSTSPRIFYTASLIWGAVGPKRMFGNDSPYHPLLWFFLAGVFLPIPGYFLHRRYPNVGWDLVNWPLILYNWGGGPVNGSGASYLMVLAVSYFSQVYAKRYRRNWYDKYNYTVSAALDSGTIVTAIILYLTVTLSKLNNAPGLQAGNYMWWALNPNLTKWGDQDYCLNYTAV
ncbi:OPT oligopeptide transporter protein-domain-containing protein [Blyttiomyces helicus]|uniref:OPT oligopeptide transporter protein-domain-containing protein n=1 Tax=Blyttiomyces helicus TaxID=388810 RepID=A0A4P9WGH5_9FUNG|nr:OPT oligopeptide transporter protein-domain-containing protein [Blyttiomyces helicus]|eukprot:RKO91921.1 OPT oligopeptide transporter protein-domain-containing protein [Blyttiomyces helicus]